MSNPVTLFVWSYRLHAVKAASVGALSRPDWPEPQMGKSERAHVGKLKLEGRENSVQQSRLLMASHRRPSKADVVELHRQEGAVTHFFHSTLEAHRCSRTSTQLIAALDHACHSLG